MPFKDTSEGQTHSFNDGCGCPEHNQPMQNNTQESLEEAELTVFWDEISRNLPKSFERETLGDAKIFNAFRIAYPKIRSTLLSKQAEEISEAVEGLKTDERKVAVWKININIKK